MSSGSRAIIRQSCPTSLCSDVLAVFGISVDSVSLLAATGPAKSCRRGLSDRFVSSGTKFGHCRRDCRVLRCHSCSTQPRGLHCSSCKRDGISRVDFIATRRNLLRHRDLQCPQLKPTQQNSALPGTLKPTKMAGHTKAAAQILAKMQSAPGTRLQPWKAACQLTLRCRPIAGDFISTESTAIPFRKSFHTFPYPRAWLHALHDNR